MLNTYQTPVNTQGVKVLYICLTLHQSITVFNNLDTTIYSWKDTILFWVSYISNFFITFIVVLLFYKQTSKYQSFQTDRNHRSSISLFLKPIEIPFLKIISRGLIRYRTGTFVTQQVKEKFSPFEVILFRVYFDCYSTVIGG